MNQKDWVEYFEAVNGEEILLIVAISTNNSAKREQEMAYLLRMMSDKLGDDK